MKTSCNYIIVYDFETGGLPDSKKVAFEDVPLVEMALVCVNLNTLEICDEIDMIFPYDYKEGLVYSDEATAVHGITKEIQKANNIPLSEIFKTCKQWFKKYKNPRQKCTMAGHNIVGFDNPFLKNFFTYMKDDIDEYVKFYLDTMNLAHISALEQIDYKLGTCCQLAGIDLVEAHRALADTRANAMLLISYIKKLRGEGVQSALVENKVRYRKTFELQ